MLIKPFPALFWVSGSAHSACVHRCLSAATSDHQAPERRGWVTESVTRSWAMGTTVCSAAHGAGMGAHSLCECTGRMCSAWLLVGTGAWTCDSLPTPRLPEPAQHFHLAQGKKRLLKISTQHVSETKFSFPVPHTVIIILHPMSSFYSFFHSGNFTHLYQSSLIIIFSRPFHFYSYHHRF